MRALLTISYDGTNYCGWQRQQNGITIQEILERAISRLYGCEITILGASRTDSGVHAIGQRATFTPPDERIAIDRLPMAINSQLPHDIRVIHSQSVPDEFHVINDTVRKTYRYQIDNSPIHNPLLNRYSQHVKTSLDYEKMKQAAKFFEGTHDFAAFCAANSSAATTTRTIYSLEFSKEGHIITFDICGNGFLYNMIRIIAGSLIDVGIGKTEPAGIALIIASGQRERAGKTADAKGLTLLSIEYD